MPQIGEPVIIDCLPMLQSLLTEGHETTSNGRFANSEGKKVKETSGEFEAKRRVIIIDGSMLQGHQTLESAEENAKVVVCFFAGAKVRQMGH